MDCMSRVWWLRSRHAPLLKPGRYTEDLDFHICHWNKNYSSQFYDGGVRKEILIPAHCGSGTCSQKGKTIKIIMLENAIAKVWMPKIVICLVDATEKNKRKLKPNEIILQTQSQIIKKKKENQSRPCLSSVLGYRPTKMSAQAKFQWWKVKSKSTSIKYLF